MITNFFKERDNFLVLAEILDEKRSKFLNNAYNKIRKGKYEYVEDYMRKYLKLISNIFS